VKEFALKVALATHPRSGAQGSPEQSPERPSSVERYVRYGASPRGAQAIILAAKIRALVQGRFNVAFEDVQHVAGPALRHRVLLNFEGEAEGITTDEIIRDILASVTEASSPKVAV
jgi:MoxR-like ATPase